MNDAMCERDAFRMARDGWSDEDVERLTGLSISCILAIRAQVASEPARVWSSATYLPTEAARYA